MSAERIIATLLEDDAQRACSECDKATGSVDPLKSYALCKRHHIQWLTSQGMPQTGINEIVSNIEHVRGFPPDTSHA